jgi:hypothetical protein
MNMKGLRLVAAVGLLFLFMACEKDIEGGFGKGEKVEIFFSTDIINYSTAEDVVRSGDMREAESRTIYINDSIYLQTTLVPDSEEDLRATVGFIDGQKIVFEAYDTSSPSTAVDSKTYTYSEDEGKFIPDTEPLGVVPDGTTTYRFVAYSYFGETDAPSTTIDLSRDLVWGKSTDRTVNDTETSRTATINMTHLFARVKVLVKSGISTVTITDLRDVEIEGSTWTTVNAFDGSFGTASTVKQWIEFDEDELPAEEIESGQRLVFPVTTAPAKVKFGTIEISATAPFSDQTVKFNSTLDAGTSYTLVVDVKRCIWARSNIYWQEVTDDQDPKYPGYLTFVPAGNDLSKQGYQGVLFKWGSLVGVSPVGNNYDNNTTLYVPYDYTDAAPTAAKWLSTTRDKVKNDTKIPEATDDWTKWAYNASTAKEIPYLDPTYAGSNYGRDNEYAIDADRNNQTMYQSLRGDICQYLSKTNTVSGKYRLPTSNEFGQRSAISWTTSSPNADGWIRGINPWPSDNSAAGKADGTADLLVAAKNNGNAVYGSAINRSMGDVVFPASGYRNIGGGTLIAVGTVTYFWSGSAYSTTYSYSMGLGDGGGQWPPELDRDRGRGSGFPVRCVLN